MGGAGRPVVRSSVDVQVDAEQDQEPEEDRQQSGEQTLEQCGGDVLPVERDEDLDPPDGSGPRRPGASARLRSMASAEHDQREAKHGKHDFPGADASDARHREHKRHADGGRQSGQHVAKRTPHRIHAITGVALFLFCGSIR